MALALALPLAGAPAAEHGEAITLERIMADPDWLGNPPEDPYWSDDGRWIYYEQKRQGEELRDLMRVPAGGGEPVAVSDAERGAADVAEGDLSDDRRFKAYVREGDVFVKELASGEVRQLTRTAAEERAPRFLTGGAQVTFERGDTLLVRDLATGLEWQPVDLRLADDPAEDEPESYLERQQLRLLDAVRERREDDERERERERAAQRADPTRPPLPWYLGDEVEIVQKSLSPSGDRLALVVIAKERDEGEPSLLPDYVTASGYVETREVRAKVGTGDDRSERLWILDLVRREKHEVDLAPLPGIAEDPLAELRAAAEKAAAEREAERGKDAEGDEEDGDGDKEDEDEEDGLRAVTFEPFAWSDDGELLAVEALSRDNKDRWIAVVRRGESALTPVHRLHDDAWINWLFNDFGWLPDSHTLYYLSEESGASQLYVQPLDGPQEGPARRLSGGRGVVTELTLDRAGDYFYYAANPDHPGVFEAYRVPSRGGEVEQLTRLGGVVSTPLPSPAGDRLLMLHATTTRPPEVFVQDELAAQEGETEAALDPARRLTHTVSEAFAALPWIAPEVVAVPSTDQERPIYSRLYLPPAEADAAYGAAPGAAAGGARPAVMFVHGAGYLQNAHLGWSSYFREFMFHTFLARRGYVVLDMDYRGSAGYGAAWRTAIYRQMGTPELDDLADGVAWLAAHHGVARDRVGVYGGSYGGFLTLMALFKQPDLFACGAALRPVTDWAHYNHGYTSNILNTPELDPEAYARSSPIEFAAGLTKPLLICAPMQDDNVFFQDTVRLAQRLIELEKEDWEVAIFPVEPHAFRRPSSWLNEYRRIFQLFERYVGRPAETGP